MINKNQMFYSTVDVVSQLDAREVLKRINTHHKLVEMLNECSEMCCALGEQSPSLVQKAKFFAQLERIQRVLAFEESPEDDIEMKRRQVG